MTSHRDRYANQKERRDQADAWYTLYEMWKEKKREAEPVVREFLENWNERAKERKR